MDFPSKSTRGKGESTLVASTVRNVDFHDLFPQVLPPFDSAIYQLVIGTNLPSFRRPVSSHGEEETTLVILVTLGKQHCAFSSTTCPNPSGPSTVPTTNGSLLYHRRTAVLYSTIHAVGLVSSFLFFLCLSLPLSSLGGATPKLSLQYTTCFELKINVHPHALRGISPRGFDRRNDIHRSIIC